MDRIVLIDGEEFDSVTGKRVYRNSKNRPYILEDDSDSYKLNAEEFGWIVLAFYRRIVQDASGLELFDKTIDEETRQDSRRYLLEGKLEQNGYWVYEGYDTDNQRVYDCRFIRYVYTEDTHESTITMQDIANIAGVDLLIIRNKIEEWSKAGWVKTHPFYINVMKATKQIG